MQRVNWQQAVRPSTHDLIAAINSGADDIGRIDGDIERIDGALDDLEIAIDGKADVSGTYPDLVAGEALSIRSGIRSNTFLSRALDADVADGIAEVASIKGNTEVVNGALVSSNVAGIDSASACEFPAQTLRGVGTAQDTMTAQGIERKIGVVDLGTLTWSKSGNRFYSIIVVATATIPVPAEFATDQLGNILCAKYETTTRLGIDNTDDAISLHGSTTLRYFNVVDSDYSTVEAFKAAMNGVILYYELATPTSETFITPIDLTYAVEAGGTETWIVPEGRTSTAVTGNIIYPVDPARALITHESFADFCDKLGAYIGATITETWDGSKYTYSFASGRSALLGSMEAEPDALEVIGKDDIVNEIIEDERKA